MNNYFAGIATDNGYIKSDVLNFCRIDGTQDCGVWNFSDYEVELYLRKIRNTSYGYIMIYHVGFLKRKKKVKEHIVLREIHLRTMGRHLSMGSHSVICHPTEVTFTPTGQVGTQFIDPVRMKG